MENQNKKRKLNILSYLIILIFSKSISQDLSDSSIYSYVIMNITEGTNKVYYDQSSSFTKPDEVYVNGIIQENKAFQEQLRVDTQLNEDLLNDIPEEDNEMVIENQVDMDEPNIGAKQ